MSRSAFVLRGLALFAIVLGVGAPAPAHAADCPHAVVFTLPGIIWADVRQVEPPELLSVAESGAVGSMAVRTNSPLTSLADAYATIGAGTRVDGARPVGSPAFSEPGDGFESDVTVSGLEQTKEFAEDAGYNAEPGALGSALGDRPLVAVGNGDIGLPPPVPAGFDGWTLAAAMDREGIVDFAATGSELLVEDATAPWGVRTDEAAITEAVDRGLALDCSSLIVDQGDGTRADLWAAIEGPRSESHRVEALLAADELLAHIRTKLDADKDLLLVVTPTSPLGDGHTHLGIAMVEGPGFDAGSELESASTGRRGFVTLPDIAPTVVEHFGLERGESMLGRAIVDQPAASADRIAAAIELDEEAVFVHERQGDIATGFVVFQVLLYAATFALLWRRRAPELRGRALRFGVLAIVAFPIVTFLLTPLRVHELGTWGFIGSLIGLDVVLVTAATLIWSDPLDRLFALSAFTFAVLAVDLLFGGSLHLNTVFGVDPIVAGRFSGVGNTAFAILGASTLLTGALLMQRSSNQKRALIATGFLFVLAIGIDGAPQLGSDVGGVIALVPTLAITWLLLGGRRPNLKTILVSAAAVVIALGTFLAVDLARPSVERTHLGRFFEDVQERGPDVFLDTIRRKARANIRVFRTTIWTYLVPPALALLTLLLLRPRGRWNAIAEKYPRLRAGLIGCLLLGALGFLVNDSGVVVPAMVLSYLVPMAVLMHLSLDSEVAR